MSYEVLVGALRAAAGRYSTVADSLGAEGVELDNLNPTSFGHIELAAWIKAVAEQCDNATKALHDGANGVADGLTTAAHHYETTDDGVAEYFRSPLVPGGFQPGAPFGPFGGTP